MRLIDVKELERQTKEAFKESPVVMGILLRWMRKQPTIDAVPVVRCRECKHYHADTLSCDFTPYAKYYERPNWYEDDFCSYGERKEGAT